MKEAGMRVRNAATNGPGEAPPDCFLFFMMVSREGSRMLTAQFSLV